MEFFDKVFSLLWVKNYEIVYGKTYGWSEVISGWLERPFLLIAILLSVIFGIILIYVDRKR